MGNGSVGSGVITPYTREAGVAYESLTTTSTVSVVAQSVAPALVSLTLVPTTDAPPSQAMLAPVAVVRTRTSWMTGVKGKANHISPLVTSAAIGTRKAETTIPGARPPVSIAASHALPAPPRVSVVAVARADAIGVPPLEAAPITRMVFASLLTATTFSTPRVGSLISAVRAADATTGVRVAFSPTAILPAPRADSTKISTASA